ncbi:MAG: response regulator, partial [Desulfohalobiaceae bacterium]
MKILLIEDNPGDARLIREMLSWDEGEFELLCEETLTKGLECLAEGPVDLVLLDLGLPESQGIETLEKFQKHSVPSLPVIVLTGLGDLETSREAIQKGAQDYLVKGSISSELLSRTVLYAHERHALGQELQRYQQRLEALVDERTHELQKANEQLRKSEQRLKEAQRIGGLGDWEWLPETNTVTWSENLSHILGLDPEQPPPDYQGQLELYHPEDAKRLDVAVTRALSEGRPYELELARTNPDGREICVQIRGVVDTDKDGQVRRLYGSLQDITERKQAEQALKESEGLFRNVFEILPVGVWITDQHGTLVRGNPAGVAIWGQAPHVGPEEYGIFKARRLPSGQEIAPDDWALAHTIKEGKTIKGELLEIDAFDGRRKIILNSTAPVLDEQGKLQAAIVVNQDITDLKRHEETIQKQYERNSLLNQISLATSERLDLDSTFDVVLGTLDTHLDTALTGVLLFNAEQEALVVTALKTPLPEEALPLRRGQVIPLELKPNNGSDTRTLEADRRSCEQPVREMLEVSGCDAVEIVPLVTESGLIGFLVVASKNRGYSDIDKEFLHQLGNHLALAVRSKMLFQKLQRAYLDLQKTQEATLQQERIRALGQMASGIVHDINNAMSPIVGYTDLLLERRDLDEKARHYLANIRRASGDVTQIIGQMREFYRKREDRENLIPVNINQVVEQVVDLTRPKWRDIPQQQGVSVIVDTDLAQDLPMLHGSESELREALTNLVLNAVDAIEKEGTILLRTSLEEGMLSLIVKDTGAGMDKATAKRALEPFFTTKGEHGTGLGLAMVYGVVQRHDGEIEIHSEPGQGTIVRMLFPPRQAKGESPKQEHEPVEPVRPLRILCIDDEAAIRKLLQDMLTMDGHEVVLAEGGSQGVEEFQSAL